MSEGAFNGSAKELLSLEASQNNWKREGMLPTTTITSRYQGRSGKRPRVTGMKRALALLMQDHAQYSTEKDFEHLQQMVASAGPNPLDSVHNSESSASELDCSSVSSDENASVEIRSSSSGRDDKVFGSFSPLHILSRHKRPKTKCNSSKKKLELLIPLANRWIRCYHNETGKYEWQKRNDLSLLPYAKKMESEGNLHLLHSFQDTENQFNIPNFPSTDFAAQIKKFSKIESFFSFNHEEYMACNLNDEQFQPLSILDILKDVKLAIRYGLQKDGLSMPYPKEFSKRFYFSEDHTHLLISLFLQYNGNPMLVYDRWPHENLQSYLPQSPSMEDLIFRWNIVTSRILQYRMERIHLLFTHPPDTSSALEASNSELSNGRDLKNEIENGIPFFSSIEKTEDNNISTFLLNQLNQVFYSHPWTQLGGGNSSVAKLDKNPLDYGDIFENYKEMTINRFKKSTELLTARHRNFAFEEAQKICKEFFAFYQRISLIASTLSSTSVKSVSNIDKDSTYSQNLTLCDQFEEALRVLDEELYITPFRIDQFRMWAQSGWSCDLKTTYAEQENSASKELENEEETVGRSHFSSNAGTRGDSVLSTPVSHSERRNKAVTKNKDAKSYIQEKNGKIPRKSLSTQPTIAVSNLSECVLISWNSKAPRLYREVEEMLEVRLLEDHRALMDDSPEIQQKLMEIRIYLIQNILIRRFCTRFNQLNQNIIKMLQTTHDSMVKLQGRYLPQV